jgi:hypothetical protein
VVGEIAVDADPAPVLDRVKPAQRIPDFRGLLAVDLQIARAAHGCGSGSQLNACHLKSACFQKPKARYRHANRSQRRGACGADQIGRRKNRIGARELDQLVGRFFQICKAEDFLQRIARGHGDG